MMFPQRIRPLLFTKISRCAQRWTAIEQRSGRKDLLSEKDKFQRICKKPIKQSMYAYKRFQTTYYDWMEAVNRVDIQQSAFYRPLVVRSTIRQILRYMHDAFIDIEQWSTFRDYLLKKDIGVSRLFDGIFLHECINHQRFLMGLSYVAYLRHEQIPLTPTGLAMLLSLARQIDIRPELHEYRLDEKMILDAHAEFLSHRIVPDSMLALPLIAGLTLTQQWKEALQYLPILDNDLDGLQQALGFVLSAAAQFHDYEFFFSLIDNISQTEHVRLCEERDRIRTNSNNGKKVKLTLDEQVKRPLAPSNVKESDYYLMAKTSQAYETFIDYLTGDETRQIETIVKLLDKTATIGYTPPISFVQALEKKLKQHDPVKYECERIYFYPNGTSLDGKSILKSIAPSENESRNLHLFVRENFQSLLQSHCPKLAVDPSKLLTHLSESFDVFFDCLHYPTLELDWRIRHPLYIKRILYQIADEKGKRCLVVAKVDLADYVESLEMPADLVSVVRVPYESIRSPLPLLAALFHSPTTLLASPIDQRSFKNILGLNHAELFDRWIQTQQLVAIAKPDLVYLQAPCLYATRVHLSPNEWLIPFFDGSPLSDAEHVQSWFRVRIHS